MTTGRIALRISWVTRTVGKPTASPSPTSSSSVSSSRMMLEMPSLFPKAQRSGSLNGTETVVVRRWVIFIFLLSGRVYHFSERQSKVNETL